MEKLPYKGYARIFVQKEEDVEIVNNILDNMDEFEASYRHKNLVTTFKGKDWIPLIYNGKYSNLDMELAKALCAEKGVFILIYKTSDYDQDIDYISY
jgi:hypothetical protein